MAFNEGSRLPGERASKLGHLSVVKSEWVKSLVQNFDQAETLDADPAGTIWHTVDLDVGVTPLQSIWAVDGSYVSISTEQKPSKEIAFVKTALLAIDRVKLNAIDKDRPHPLLLQDVLADSAVFHSTVFPLKNIRTPLGSNYDAVRHIVRDSFKVDENGAFNETLKWLAYKKWEVNSSSRSPGFECPHCHENIAAGLEHDVDEGLCPACGCKVFLSDLWGFHLDMDENSAPDSVASAYMLVMEHLMLFTAIRLMWNHSDKSLVSETLFIKDGPLSLRGQYSKIVPNIRSFLQFAKVSRRPIHLVGQEKSGAFFDHLSSIARFAEPKERGQSPSFAPLDHDYVRREVYRSPDLKNPYGKRTNWGEKIYVKIDSGTHMVLNIPTGEYVDTGNFPQKDDLIGLNRILATIPQLISHKFEGALYPVELANGIASMSSYPSASILQRFSESNTQ